MTDHGANVTRGSNLLILALRAAREGDWQPTASHFALLTILAAALRAAADASGRASYPAGYQWDCPNCGEHITSFTLPPKMSSVPRMAD